MVESSDDPGPPRPLILVVDDDADIRDVIADVLESHGFAVVGARDGRDALDKLQDGTLPDAIFLDLSMPVMNGFEFRAAQRTDARLSAIPTIVLSAASQLRERTAAMAVEAVVPKPVSLEDLVATARRWTEPRRGA